MVRKFAFRNFVLFADKFLDIR